MISFRLLYTCTHTHLLFPSEQYNCDFSPLTSHTVSYYKEISAEMTIITCTLRSDCLWLLFIKPQLHISSKARATHKHSLIHLLIYSHKYTQENQVDSNVSLKHMKCVILLNLVIPIYISLFEALYKLIYVYASTRSVFEVKYYVSIIIHTVQCIS